MVAPSAVLRGTEATGGDAGMGLYVWKNFARDEMIGRYTGDGMGRFEADDEDGKSAAILKLPEGKRDKVLE